MEYCGLSSFDLLQINKKKRFIDGATLGHEGVGIIEETHGSVKDLKVGDRVLVNWFFATKDKCEFWENGFNVFSNKEASKELLKAGSFSTKCTALAKYLIKAPAGISSEIATFLTCAGVNIYKAIELSKIKPTRKLLIFGDSFLSQLATQYAKTLFKANVFVTCPNEKSLMLSKQCGADIIYNQRNKDFFSYIFNKTGESYSAIIMPDSTMLIDHIVNLVRIYGRIVPFEIPNNVNMNNSIVSTVLLGKEIIPEVLVIKSDLEKVYNITKEKLVVPNVTIKPFSLINKVIKEINENSLPGKVVFDMGYKSKENKNDY